MWQLMNVVYNTVEMAMEKSLKVVWSNIGTSTRATGVRMLVGRGYKIRHRYILCV